MTGDVDPSAISRVAAVVLAAGAGTRFGGGKIRALLDGRPLVAHVLAAARTAGVQRIVLVLGRDAVAVGVALRDDHPGTLDGVVVAVNPAPERGLATSLRLGLAAATAEPAPDGVAILLGDQPRIRAEVFGALWSAAQSAQADTLAVVAAHAGDGAPNPVLLLPAAWVLAADLAGDRGLGPLLAADSARVLRVPVAGDNPDVDTPADLVGLATPGGSQQ